MTLDFATEFWNYTFFAEYTKFTANKLNDILKHVCLISPSLSSQTLTSYIVLIYASTFHTDGRHLTDGFNLLWFCLFTVFTYKSKTTCTTKWQVLTQESSCEGTKTMYTTKPVFVSILFAFGAYQVPLSVFSLPSEPFPALFVPNNKIKEKIENLRKIIKI